MKKNKKVLLLCGGLSERVYSHIQVPKPLFKINEKTIIENTLDIFLKNDLDLDNVYINVPKEHVQFYKEIFTKFKCNFIIENTPLGTAGSVNRILEKNSFEEIFIVYGDQYYEEPFLSEVLKSELSENSIFVINHGNINKSGIAFYNDSFYLTDFIEKPNNLSVMNRESFGINIGLYFFNDFSCLENTENKKIFDFGIDIFPRLVTKNIPIKVEMIKSLEYPIFIDDIERIRKLKR